MDEVLIVAEEAARGLELCERYARLRTSWNLPSFEREVTGAGLRLRFRELPPKASFSELAPELCCFALARLAGLEADWGCALSQLAADDLLHDPVRGVFTVGPGLFRNGQGATVVRALLQRLDVDPGADVTLTAAAALVAERYPKFEAVLTGVDAGERVRALVEEAAARLTGDPAAASVLLRTAWRLRPGDVQVGVLWLSAEAAVHGTVPSPELDPVAADLCHRDPDNVEVLRLVAQREERRGDVEAARTFARRAAELDPSCKAAWAVLARVARRQANEGDLDASLDGLAGAGEPSAVLLLAQRHGVARAGRHLDRWSWPWTRSLAQLRLAWLAREERLREVVQFFFGNVETFHPLEETDMARVLDAGERLPGRLRAIRDLVKSQLEARPPTRPLVEAYVRVCEREAVPRAILDARLRWAGLVPHRSAVAAATAERQWSLVFTLTAAGEFPEFRFLALTRDALARGTPADAGDLWATVRRVRPEARRALVLEELANLERVAPHAAITAQLRELLGELE